jgi:hypothetical protein
MADNADASRSRTTFDADDDRTPLERALDARRHGEPSAPLDDDLQRLVDDLAPWLDALRAAAQEAADDLAASPSPDEIAQPTAEPVSADDPVALMLGLVPEPNVAIDGHKLTQARKRARLDLKEMVERLRYRGWPIDMKEGLRWHTGITVLPPALIATLANALGVDESFISARAGEWHRPDELFDDARISAFLSEWAAEIHVEPGELRNQISGLLTSASRRNSTTSSSDTLLAVLKAFRAIPHLLDRT